MAPAALGRVVVRWHVRFGHKDKEFPDVAFNASAQLGLGCRGVVPEGLAEAQQLSFQGQSSLPEPTNVTAANGSNYGDVTVSWGPVTGGRVLQGRLDGRTGSDGHQCPTAVAL